jgi:hypothetical protein
MGPDRRERGAATHSIFNIQQGIGSFTSFGLVQFLRLTEPRSGVYIRVIRVIRG